MNSIDSTEFDCILIFFISTLINIHYCFISFIFNSQFTINSIQSEFKWLKNVLYSIHTVMEGLLSQQKLCHKENCTTNLGENTKLYIKKCKFSFS